MALTRMRMENEECSLWIDAVCVNQSDLHEKSRQVGMMGLIYRHARATLIQLGSLDDESQSIKELGEILSRVHEKVKLTMDGEPLSPHETVFKALCVDDESDGMYGIRALELLFGVPWLR